MRVSLFLASVLTLLPSTEHLRAQDNREFAKRLAAELERVKKEVVDDRVNEKLDQMLSSPPTTLFDYETESGPLYANARCRNQLADAASIKISGGIEGVLVAARTIASGRGLRLFVLDRAAAAASPKGTEKLYALYRAELGALQASEPAAVANQTKQLAQAVRANSREGAQNACIEVTGVEAYSKKIAEQPKK